MARALRRDADAELAGELDHRDNVFGRLREDDRGGPLVGGEVPRLPRRVPAVLAEEDHGPGHAGAQSFDFGCFLSDEGCCRHGRQR